MKHVRFVALAAGLMLLAQGAARAQTYKIQPIAKLGDKVGDLTFFETGDFEIGALNDAGQIVFVSDVANGVEGLFQFADGKITAIAAPNGDAPGGKWPAGLGLGSPVNMNQAGNIVFAALEGTTPVGTFLWDFKAKQVKPVALKGMPVPNNLTLEDGADFGPTINNSNEVAFAAHVKNAAGSSQLGVFFLGRDGKLQAIALPDQDLFGAKVNRARFPVVNDAGLVAFQARREGDTTDSAYLWEGGNITRLTTPAQDAPGGGKIVLIFGLRVNNANKNVLVGARLDDTSNGPFALYLFAGGKLQPVATPGMDMPGGGKLKAVGGGNNNSLYGVSWANDAGQVAFLATLDDGTTGLYLMNPDGKLSKVLKQGETTSIGKIDNVGQGAQNSIGTGLNNKGQIAVTVLPANGDDTLVLLTPK